MKLTLRHWKTNYRIVLPLAIVAAPLNLASLLLVWCLMWALGLLEIAISWVFWLIHWPLAWAVGCRYQRTPWLRQDPWPIERLELFAESSWLVAWVIRRAWRYGWRDAIRSLDNALVRKEAPHD